MGPKRKRTSLSIAQKIDILKKLDCGISSKSVQQEYDIGASTVSDIKHAKDKIRSFFQNTIGSFETTGVFSRKLPLLDNELYEWFVQQRSKGVSITGPMLQEKARSFNRSYNRLIFLLLYVLQGQNEENIFKLEAETLTSVLSQAATSQHYNMCIYFCF